MDTRVSKLANIVDDKTIIAQLIRENSERVRLIEFKDARADIWQFFRLVCLDGITLPYAVCIRCMKPVSYKAREGTGGLHRHPCSKQAIAAALAAGIPFNTSGNRSKSQQSSGSASAAASSSRSLALINSMSAMSRGWLSAEKTDNRALVRKNVDTLTDDVQSMLKKMFRSAEINEQHNQELKKRKLVHEITIKSYDIDKAPQQQQQQQPQQQTCAEKHETPVLETDLTSDMISNGTWKEKKFIKYDFEAMGVPPESGHLHPLIKMKQQFRQIFLEMGFTEMPTNNFIESCFWNFDALFVSQQHTARDVRHTFYVNEPEKCDEVPEDYMERIKKVHSEGAYCSRGYKYGWKAEESRRNVLRTHAKSLSARLLYSLAKECAGKPFKLVMLFSIDRVFRNETLDSTHLAEFHQIEAVVADIGLTLCHLFGLIKDFLCKFGINELKFKPSYNPSTEPSVKISCYHNQLKKWVTIGNCGLFRPEILLPMGLPSDISVLTWNLGLERLAMLKYGFDNISDLVGHDIDLKMIIDNRVCH